MSPDPRTTIGPHLASGERLLWAATADTHSVRRLAWRETMQKAGFFGFVVAGIVVAALTTDWLDDIARNGAGGGTIVVALVLGLSFFFGPWRAFSRATALIGATYAISERRLIVLRASDPIEVRSAPLERVVCVERLERADGSGDLLVHVAQPDAKASTENTPLRLIGVPGCRAAEGLMIGRSSAPP